MPPNDETAAGCDGSLRRVANRGLELAITHAFMESVDVTIALGRLPRKAIGAAQIENFPVACYGRARSWRTTLNSSSSAGA